MGKGRSHRGERGGVTRGKGRSHRGEREKFIARGKGRSQEKEREGGMGGQSVEGQRGVSYIIQVYTSGGTNKEFNLRHDWHSLFSNDSQLEMRHYSTKYFPDADEYVCAHGPTSIHGNQVH